MLFGLPPATGRDEAAAPVAEPSEGCDGSDQLFVSGQPSLLRTPAALPLLDVFAPAGGCNGARPESRTLGGDVAAVPRPIVAAVFGAVSLQPVAQLSFVGTLFVVVGAEGRDGSTKGLWSGCVLFDAILGEVGAERPVEVVDGLKPVVVGAWGIKSGGAATAVPMLDQPPSMGDMVTVLGRTVVGGMVFVGVEGQAGAADGFPVVVFVQGDETPPRAALVVAFGVAGAANGLDLGAGAVALLKPCSAARMPASTPSRIAVPVSLNAFCVRWLIDGALGATGWP